MPSRWVHEHRFPDPTALAHALAGEIRVDLEEAVGARRAASLVVSGGRTPKQLFKQLSTEQTDWKNVWITLADERWVDTASEDSNERLVRENLVTGAAAGARFVGLKNPAVTPEAGVEWSWRALSRVPRPFDIVMLGMGNDGHTASLFPGSMALARGLDVTVAPGCIAVNALAAPHARISLNLAAILDARRIVLHIEGDAKWQIYQRARTPGSTAELPIRAVLHQKEVPVDVFWAP